MSDSSNVSVDGAIEAGFTSYGVPKQTSEDENGEIETNIWPEHIDSEELTDTQREVLQIAFSNPTLTVKKVEQRAGVSRGYASRLLRDKVPDWYENQFKSDVAKARSAWANEDDTDTSTDVAEEPDTSDSQADETPETDIEEILGVLKQTAVHQETKQTLEVLESYL